MFHQDVVQQGHPCLQGDQHAGPVDLRQDVVGKIVMDVDVLQPRQVVLGAGLRGQAYEPVVSCRQRQPGARLGGEELAQTGVRLIRHHPKVALERRHAEECQMAGATHTRGRCGREQSDERSNRTEMVSLPLERQRVGVAAVAGEALVPAVARERDRHVLARDLGHAVGGHRRGVRERLVELPGESWQDLHDVGLDHQLDVVGGIAKPMEKVRTG